MLSKILASAKSGGLGFLLAGLVLVLTKYFSSIPWILFALLFLILTITVLTLFNCFTKKYLRWTLRSFNNWDDVFDAAYWYFVGYLISLFVIRFCL